MHPSHPQSTTLRFSELKTGDVINRKRRQIYDNNEQHISQRQYHDDFHPLKYDLNMGRRAIDKQCNMS